MHESEMENQSQSLILSVFWNQTESRLRTGWRLLGLLIIVIIISIAIGIVAQIITIERPSYLGQLQSNIVMIVAIWIAARFLDRRDFSETGIKMSTGWWLDLVFGLLLGIVLMALIFATEYYSGWIKITDTFQTGDPAEVFWIALLIPIILYISIGIAEELAFRGYFLLNLAEGLNFPSLGPVKAVVFSWLFTSLIFGIAHMFNPNASLISSLNISLGGIFLGLAYVYTGSLAIPIGIHISWNFFQGIVFGFPVSGQNYFATKIFSIEQGGPDIFTGGDFGPEAGILGLAAIVFGIVLTMLWIRLRYGSVRLFSAIAVAPVIESSSEDET